MKTHLLLIAAVISLGVAHAGEVFDRHVDRAALDAQHQAIAKLKTLVKRYRGTSRESMLLMKLAEIEQATAAVEFRVAHGLAKSADQANLAHYHTMLRDTVATLDTVIARFPKAATSDQAYFMRGSAEQELTANQLAKRDYLYLVNHFADSAWFYQSTMALADYAIDENQHRLAITYLDQVVAHPEDPHYPFALYKEAWSHFNLKEIAVAIGYLEKHVRFYDQFKELAESDVAMREHSCLDVAVFAVDGLEKGMTAYAPAQALELFKKFDDGAILGKVAARYAKLLRAHGRDADLTLWRDRLIEQEPLRPETLEVVALAFEYFYNQRDFVQMDGAARAFARLDVKTEKKMRGLASYPDAEKMLLSTADRLQALSVKNKASRDVVKLTQALSSVYQAFTAIVDENDSRIPRVRYNLAETLFEVKDYERATEHYQWAIEHWSSKTGLARKDLELKRIASRYEALRAKNALPETLKPEAPTGPESLDLKALAPHLGEWLAWVDAYANAHGLATEPERNFAFEANRAIYAQGQTRVAVDRLQRFATDYPNSRFTTPSLSLVLDTEVSAKDWIGIHALSERFESLKGLDATFVAKLHTLSADAYFATIESLDQKKDYASALREAAVFQKKFPAHPNVPAALFLAGKIALENGDRKLAVAKLTELLDQFPKDKNRAQAFWIRGKLAEESYAFVAAAADYRAELAAEKVDASSDKRKDLEKRILLFSWLGGEQPAACVSDEDADCDRIQALTALKAEHPATGDALDAQVQKSKHGIKENRALWAAAALRGQGLAYPEKLQLARALASGWHRLEPIAQYVTIPTLNAELPQVLSEGRTAIKTLAPLKANARALKRRIEWMGELETAAASAAKLPWARVRAAMLKEMGEMYTEFSRDLAALPAPKDLSEEDKAEYAKSVAEIVNPFAEKGERLRLQAFEVASTQAVEHELVGTLAPNRALASVHVRAKPIDADLLDGVAGIDPRIAELWKDALEQGRWAQVAFFVQELKDKFNAPAPTLKLMRAIALAPVGAQAEALQELEDVKSDLSADKRREINRILYSQYMNSLAEKKAQAVASEMERSKS